MKQRLQELLAASQPQLEAVASDFSQAHSRYAAFRSSSESALVRWEWSSSLPRYELDPLYFLNDSAKRGRTAKKEPESPSGKHVYGFGEDGRIVVEREHVEFAGKYYETFFSYGLSDITSYRYSYDESKQPINCYRLMLSGGVPVALHGRATYGSSANVYILDSGKIRYFSSLNIRDHRDQLGSCGELVFGDSSVQLWHFLNGEARKLSFTGDQSLYNTFLALRTNNAPHRDGREASRVGQPSSAPAGGRTR